MKIKERLDQKLLELYPDFSRNQVQSYIMQGKVTVNDQIITKAGFSVKSDDKIELNVTEPKYVCRAGWKLEKALDHFNIDPSNLTILDAGLSTGGFTDCLLQRGAKKIYGVDVGYGQAHEKIRQDPRVIVKEKTNLRYLEDLGEKIDLVTLDLSFISILKVLDGVKSLLKENGELVTLIKPQFEAKRFEVGKGGIIRDPELRLKIVLEVIEKIEKFGFICQGYIESPITGTAGNVEYLAYFQRN